MKDNLSKENFLFYQNEPSDREQVLKSQCFTTDRLNTMSSEEVGLPKILRKRTEKKKDKIKLKKQDTA